MKDLRSLKSSYVIIIFLIIVGITTIAGTYKPKPILESSDIPGYYLGLQRGNSEDVAELADERPEYSVIKNTKRYKRFNETGIRGRKKKYGRSKSIMKKEVP